MYSGEETLTSVTLGIYYLNKGNYGFVDLVLCCYLRDVPLAATDDEPFGASITLLTQKKSGKNNNFYSWGLYCAIKLSVKIIA